MGRREAEGAERGGMEGRREARDEGGRGRQEREADGEDEKEERGDGTHRGWFGGARCGLLRRRVRRGSRKCSEPSTETLVGLIR